MDVNLRDICQFATGRESLLGLEPRKIGAMGRGVEGFTGTCEPTLMKEEALFCKGQTKTETGRKA